MKTIKLNSYDLFMLNNMLMRQGTISMPKMISITRLVEPLGLGKSIKIDETEEEFSLEDNDFEFLISEWKEASNSDNFFNRSFSFPNETPLDFYNRVIALDKKLKV